MTAPSGRPRTDASEMVERVVQAIRENVRPDRDITDAARAAILAMREPTERLAYVGGTAFEAAAFAEGKLVFEGASDAWRAMIDEALREPAANEGDAA